MIYGLIGHPLTHSFSPTVHGLLGGYPYQLFDLAEGELPAFLRREDLGGVNVTIPYKRTVFSLCDTVSPTARAVGCVNTVVRNADGTLCGDNTDYAGFAALLRRAGISPKGKTVAVLGTGGGSLAVQAVCRDMGAAAIEVYSRTPTGGQFGYPQAAASRAAIIVNATPVGMAPAPSACPIEDTAFSQAEFFADLIYNPHRSGFCLLAKSRGIPYQNGLSMLVEQAAAAIRLFGKEVAPAQVEFAIREIDRQRNLVLIGMPGCGKSTVARMIARKWERRFIDLDEEVERLAGKSIPEIFAEGGEPLFRAYERQAVAACAELGACVIATGGGVVLDPKNRAPLLQNGTAVFLNRPLEDLPTEGRPLSRDLAAMWENRLPLYRAFCDHEVSNRGTLAAVAAETERVF